MRLVAEADFDGDLRRRNTVEQPMPCGIHATPDEISMG